RHADNQGGNRSFMPPDDAIGAQALSPAAVVTAIDSRAERLSTPCGDGSMVWRRWGNGPALVLLHGGYGSWTHWLRNVENLASRYSVLACDLPGLGESA